MLKRIIFVAMLAAAVGLVCPRSAQATVTTTASSVSYTGNGSTTAFTVPFKFLASTDLVVTVAGVTRLSTDYSVTGAGVATGGTVTFTTAPANAAAVVISRVVPLQQPTSFRTQGKFDAPTHETAFDRLAMQIQQVQSQVANPVLPSTLTNSTPVQVTGTTTPRPLADLFADAMSAKDCGAVGDGVADDTAAIQLCITAAVSAGKALYFPSGTYRTIPATASTDAAGALTISWPIVSNMRLIANGDATLKLANNVSTDGAPKLLAMFHTNAAVSNISFIGLTLDMNGANNKISPARPTYNRFNMAHISVSGNSANASDVLIQNCTFQNTPGTNAIVAGQVTAGTAGTLGQRWRLINNNFINNGLDTDDHTSVYAWVENVVADGNTFRSDAAYSTTGVTGMRVAWEVHGADQVWTKNKVLNALRCAWIATNYTSPVTRILLSDNICVPNRIGFDFFRDASGQTVKNVIISNNHFVLDDYVFTGFTAGADFKVAVQILEQYKIADVLVQGNYAVKTGTTVAAAFFYGLQGTLAAQGYDHLRVINNVITGFAVGIEFRSQLVTAPWGQIEAIGNVMHGLNTMGVFTGIGVFVDATGTIASLKIDGNSMIDPAGTTPLGVYLQNGTITDLWMGQTFYKGVVTPYTEAGGIAITRRNGGTGSGTNISTGVGSVRMRSVNPGTNAAWLPLEYKGVTYYVPAWSNDAP